MAVEAAKRIVDQLGARIGSRRRHAKSTAGSSKLNNLLAEGQPYMARKVGDLNTDRYSVNCRNGTIEFHQVEDRGRGERSRRSALSTPDGRRGCASTARAISSPRWSRPIGMPRQNRKCRSSGNS
jgi:hypothetical protein